MEQSKWFAGRLAPVLLLACFISLAGPCAAQDADVPTVSDVGKERGSLIAPSGWLLVDVPAQKRVDLKLYGFYIGNAKAPVAQVDVSVRLTKFLTVTPSYMGYSVPASGLNELTPKPGNFTDTYKENQFRIDGTVAFSVRKLEISARNMYVRRFRPSPLDDMSRYRGRAEVAYPIAVGDRIWKPFASYESFYEPNGGWNRNRVRTGVTLPLTNRVKLQPSYLWESSTGNRDVHYLLFGLIVRTGRPFAHKTH
jgi:hypothetical protein